MAEDNQLNLASEEIQTALKEQGWVSPEDIKSAYVTKAYHTDKFSKEKTRFDERVAGRKSLEEAMADDEWTSKILKEKNVVPNQDLEKRLEELKTKVRGEIEEKELKPVKTEYEAMKLKLASLTTSQLKSKLTQTGAGLGLKDEYLTEKGAEALYKFIGSEYGHDDATGQWYKTGQNGFETSTVAGQSYMTVEEHLKQLKKDPAMGAILFKPEGQSGPGVTPSRTVVNATPAKLTGSQKIAAALKENHQ